MSELLTNAALNTANAAIERTPEKILTDKTLGALDPSLQKQFDQTVNANNLLGQSGIATAPNNDAQNAATEETSDLGWVNWFRGFVRGAVSGNDVKSLTYKETYIDPITESITNNKVVDMSEAIVKNAITEATQSAAETLQLVKRKANGEYEQLLDLDPKVLDERISELNNLIKDKNVQKEIGETAGQVLEASKKPIEEAQLELVKITAKMVEDVSGQGALALGNVLKVLPVVGNVLSALGALQNITDVFATTAKGANEALNVVGDLNAGMKLGLAEEAVKASLDDPIKLLAAFETFKSAANGQIQTETSEIEELKKKMDSGTISNNDKIDATTNITKKERHIEEYKSRLDEWTNNEKVKEAQTRLPSQTSAFPPKPGSATLPSHIPSQGGGTKSRKRRAHANKQTLKRISDCLKQHFSKTRCATRKSHTKKKRKHINHMK